MPKPPPEKWTLRDAEGAVVAPALLDVARRFTAGDHYQGGDAWIGPDLSPDDSRRQGYRDAVSKSFISSNKIGEVKERHVMGVLGKEPRRTSEPREPLAKGQAIPAAMQTQIDTLARIHAAAWKRNKMHGRLQEAVSELLHAERQPVYLYVPPGLLEEEKDADGKPTGSFALPQAVDGEPREDTVARMEALVRVRFPAPEHCAVYTDPDTLQEVGVYLYEVDGQKRADIAWVDKEGYTVLRQLGGAEAVDPAAKDVRYDFGGRLPMFEMRRPLLITPQVIQNQQGLNLALTVIGINTTFAGFRARILWDADLPGKVVDDGQGGQIRVPDAVSLSPRGITQFQSRVEDKADGSPALMNGRLQTEDPVPVANAVEAVDAFEWRIHAETDQLHALISGDATASAVSRVMARAGFVASLMRTKPTVDACLEWEMETRLAMAEGFAAGKGVKAERTYTGELRPVSDCRLDPGPITPEEKRVVQELREGGRISEETALAMLGVDDVQEELERLKPEQDTARRKAALEVAIIIKDGFSTPAAVAYLEETGLFTPALIDAFRRNDFTDGPAQ